MSAAVLLAMPTATVAPRGDTGSVASADDGAFAGLVAAETATADTAPPAAPTTTSAEHAQPVAAPNQVHALISTALAFALQPRPAEGGAAVESTGTAGTDANVPVAATVSEDQLPADPETTIGASDLSSEIQAADTDQPSSDSAASPQPAVTPLPEPVAVSVRSAASDEAASRLTQAVAPSPIDTTPDQASPAPAEQSDGERLEAPAASTDASTDASAASPTATAAQAVAKALAALNVSPTQTLQTLAPERVSAPVAKRDPTALTASEPTVAVKDPLPTETPLSKTSPTETTSSETSFSQVSEGAATRTSPVAAKAMSDAAPAAARPPEAPVQPLAPSIEAIET
ncbi:hypothetical protein, partial [Brevundimonas sp.]|uniref:hypothetical protein n=1 Tax=Brevundimonas sp. TaxID=1871086 RepID=UPI001A30E82D